MTHGPFALLWPPPQRVETLAGTWSTRPEAQLEVARTSGLPRSGYRLRADATGARAEASDDAGARNAARTFDQILRIGRRRQAQPSVGSDSFPAVLPAVLIEDWPDFARRGVLLDVSRCRVPRMDTLFRLVDWLSSLKYDELQLYTEHTFAYAGHEEVWRDASPMRAEEVRELDAYCRARGIELVANQQSLGHMHRWLAHDRYRPLSEVPEGVVHAFGLEKEPFSLCPTDPASLRFLAELYDQLLPCFSSSSLHVGLDETFDVGTGRSKEACEARGKGRIHLEFLLEIHRLARERGKRIQFWGDFVEHHPELVGELPRDVVPMLWGYEADHSFAVGLGALQGSGLEFHVCPGTASWQSVAGRIDQAAKNLANAALEGREAGAAGYLVTDWGDRGHLQPLFASLPGFLLGAGFAWNASAARRGDVDLPRLLDAHAFNDPDAGLGAIALALAGASNATGCPSTNGSALFFLLAFAAEPLPHPRMPGLSIEGLERALSVVEGAEAGLARVRGDADSALVDEMRFAARLLAFACRFGRARLRTPAGAPVGAIPVDDRRTLVRELEPLIAEHARLWLLRSRPGGLEESSGWLRRVADRLAG